MARGDESLPLRMVEVGDEGPEEAADIQGADRLGVEPELRPGQDLGQLLERPEAAGQGEEGVRQLGHDGLSLVERRHDPQLRHALVRELALDEPGRDDPGDATAGRQGAVRDRAHQPDGATAVDELDAAFGERPADERGDLRVPRIPSGARAAEHADPAQGGLGRHQNPSSRRIGVIRRAAAARCEIRFFSSCVQSPSVRPPGGSERRLEDRVVAEAARAPRPRSRFARGRSRGPREW